MLKNRHMKLKKFFLFFPFVFALLFVYLFKGQPAGINVLLFNLILLGSVYGSGRLLMTNRLHLLVSSGLLLSALMVLLYGSIMAITANVFSIILFLGFTAAGDIKLLLNGFPVSVFAAFTAPYYYFNELLQVTGQKSSGRRLLRFTLVVLTPIVFLLIFTTIYASASPYFNNLTGGLLEKILDFFDALIRIVSPESFWLAVAGFLIITAFLSGKSNQLLLLFDENGSMQLLRKRRIFSGRMPSLKTEYRSGVVTLILLNLLLAVMNVLDIYNVWLFFEWNGLYLKQFVHEGTWLLIFSILISIVIVLYYFRANLNFYPKRSLLLSLAMIWLAQNALLAVSVGVRNMWYIHHFNLAYKRIGVYAFLLLTLVGLVTVILKIKKRKTHLFLFHNNALAAYAVLIGLSLFNWDSLIATYNVKHARKAFFHPEFMITLNSSSLPALQHSAKDISKIETAQFAKFDYYRDYMSLTHYKERVDTRCHDFVKGYPLVSWQGWNLADYRAYKTLTMSSERNLQPSE